MNSRAWKGDAGRTRILIWSFYVYHVVLWQDFIYYLDLEHSITGKLTVTYRYSSRRMKKKTKHLKAI